MDEEPSERDKLQTTSDEQNKDLILPITNEKVKESVFAKHPENSPGPDGLIRHSFKLIGA